MAGLNASKVASAASGNRVEQEVVEPGTCPARVVQIIDLGVQPQRPYKGQEKPPIHCIQLTYELVDEFMKDEDGNDVEDKPRWLSEDFPLHNIGADLAKSTKRYKALDPEMHHEGDFGAVLGAGCNVLVGTYISKKDGKPRNKVGDVSAMRAKDLAKLEPLVNEPKVFSLEEPDMEVFLSLPQWLQDKIKGNLEYQGSPLQAALEGGSPAPQKEAPVVGEEDEDEAEEGNGAW